MRFVYVILSLIHYLAQEILGTAIIYSHVYLHHSENERDSFAESDFFCVISV